MLTDPGWRADFPFYLGNPVLDGFGERGGLSKSRVLGASIDGSC